jgi:thiol:disulfide interchange protein DsbD
LPLRLLALALFLLAALPVLGASPAAAQSAPASSGDLLATIGRLQADNKGAGTGNEVRTDNVTARLVADLAAATPGGTLTLAFVQDIREGWHTYWRNPGDSGAPATLAWDLPPGVAIGPIQWPAPEAIPYFGLMTFGHHDRLVLLDELRIPADWPAGTALPIRLEADWLVCAEICIPERGSLALDIPVGTMPVPADAPTLQLIEAARAALPRASPWAIGFNADATTLRLATDAGLALDGMSDRVSEIRFFPDQPGHIENVAEPVRRDGPDGLTLDLARPAGAATLPDPLTGVLVLTEDLPDGPLRQAFLVEAAFDPSIGLATGSEPEAGELGLVRAALLALLGGILLNLMPCVFPVLSIKALALVRHAGGPRALAQGLAYTLGVLTTFLALAGLLIALQAGGALVGWGFQLQQPLVVALLAYLVFAIGLWLIGAFELAPAAFGRVMGLGQGRLPQHGLGGSFATGVLAVLVASPCTAPFMAAAIGFALTQGPVTALIVFAALGLGLALPYLALSASPWLQRRLPRPGAWMVRFRQLMAFPMFATAAWLVWVLAQQAGDRALLLVLLGFVALGLAIWVLRLGGRLARTAGVAALALALLLAALPGRLPAADPAHREAGPAEPFTAELLADLRREGRPVFVNMTAAWCLTCLVNEQAALSGPAFEAALERHDIAYLVGDWTRQDPAITRFLRGFERSGVPLYVVFPVAGPAVVLPQLLTPTLVLDALADAAAGIGS